MNAQAQIYNSINAFWTEARVIRLRELFEKGLSNNQIAVAMDVKTRSAVIGKLHHHHHHHHRLGLRREPLATVSKQSRGARGIINRVQSQRPHRPLEAFVRTRPIIKGDVGIEFDGVTDIAIEFSAGRVSLLSACTNQCRCCCWPAADDGSATMVCGDKIVAGSFCARHAVRGFRRPDASRGGAGAV